MYQNTIALCGGLVAALLLCANINAQNEIASPHSSPSPAGFERDDIFDRLAPLVRRNAPVTPEEAEVSESPEPEARDGNDAPLIQLQSSVPQQPPAEPAGEPDVASLSPKVQSLLQHGTSHLEPAARDAYFTSELISLSQDELVQLVTASAGALAEELSGVHFGDRWLNYLSLRQLDELLGDADAELDAAEINPRQQRLHSILQSYDRITRDRQFDVITGRHNFRLLHHGLAEMLAGPDERQQRAEAHQAVAQLMHSLQPIATGAQWNKYFQTQRVAHLLTSPRPLSRDEKGELQLILSRFQKAAADSRFEQVTGLTGFADTHAHLQSVVAVIPDAESPAVAVGASPTEVATLKGAAQVRIFSEPGIAAIRRPRQADWKAAGTGQILTSPTEIKTNEDGVARLVIGTSSEVVCAPGSVLQIQQVQLAENQYVTELNVQRGSLKLASRKEPDLSPDPLAAGPQQLIAIAYRGHRLISRGEELELLVREEPEAQRVIASVYAGSILVAHGAGDEVTIRVGREAVMLPAGLAIRPAAKKPAAWWPARTEQPTSARNPSSRSPRR